MIPLVIGIAGGIGSGKSTIARLLADYLRCPLVSYGDYFRKLIDERDQRIKRSLMQKLSAEIIGSIGIDGLTKRVFENVKWERNSSLVVDGIRNSESIQALKLECFPIPVVVVYLDVDRKNRLSRFSLRDNLDAHDLINFDDHATERSVHTIVKSLADIVIEANDTADLVLRSVLTELDRSYGTNL